MPLRNDLKKVMVIGGGVAIGTVVSKKKKREES